MRARLGSLTVVLVSAALLAGCGDDDFGEVTVEPTPGEETTETIPREGAAPGASEEDLRPKVQTCRSELVAKRVILAVNVDCGIARSVVVAWTEGETCAPTATSGRSSCTVEGFRCLATSADQGTSVSCTRERRSVGFLAPPP